MSFLDQRLDFTEALPQWDMAYCLYVKSAGTKGWYVGDSEIAGQGVFADKVYSEGDVIELAMTYGGKDELGLKILDLTECARYCNHQTNANAKLEKDGNSFYIVASKEIQPDDEISVNYAHIASKIGPGARMLWQGKPVPTTTLQNYVELD
jgi:hypothetical protein